MNKQFNPRLHVRVGELAEGQLFTYEGIRYRIEAPGRYKGGGITVGTVQVYNFNMRRVHCLAKRSIVLRTNVEAPAAAEVEIEHLEPLKLEQLPIEPVKADEQSAKIAPMENKPVQQAKNQQKHYDKYNKYR